MRTSNAIVDIIKNTSATLESEAQNICEYIAQGLDDGIVFSRLIAESPKNLGYAIHPDSFFSVTEMLIKRMGPKIYPELYVCDDLRFYRFTEGEPMLRPNFRATYASINVEENTLTLYTTKDIEERLASTYKVLPQAQKSPAVSQEEICEPATSATAATVENPIKGTLANKTELSNPLLQGEQCNVAKSALPNSPQEKPGLPTSTVENAFSTISNPPDYKIPVPDNIPFNDNNITSKLQENNNMTILFYTIAAYVLIQAWAYWDRNYNRNDNEIEHTPENVLHSAHEHMFNLIEITNKLLLSLVPSFFVIMYHLRYYYYYKYFFK